ncbi:hypothetical protein BJ138DRAFT_1103352 [Hygrophoropsis aurantiaca]|uniref:Uncharacterized protein n=1 Tax=Hygrophoropsis aurantiaca TaxID=72124 RepID=A0ACB8A5Z4_9AGAM|nr:hypothetical protein BJ138DRAFT_1103352 [Hygrophoropsis aurantiaca]
MAWTGNGKIVSQSYYHIICGGHSEQHKIVNDVLVPEIDVLTLAFSSIDCLNWLVEMPLDDSKQIAQQFLVLRLIEEYLAQCGSVVFTAHDVVVSWCFLDRRRLIRRGGRGARPNKRTIDDCGGFRHGGRAVHYVAECWRNSEYDGGEECETHMNSIIMKKTSTPRLLYIAGESDYRAAIVVDATNLKMEQLRTVVGFQWDLKPTKIKESGRSANRALHLETFIEI